jgi:glycosyltransferase involved in cell wall biosynthesis
MIKVLYITRQSLDAASVLYRCHNMVNQLHKNALEIQAETKNYLNITKTDLDHVDIVIFHRFVGNEPPFEWAILNSKIIVGLDFDDLTFLPFYYSQSGGHRTNPDRDLCKFEGEARERFLTLCMVDFVIVSTSELSDILSSLGIKSYLVKNCLPQQKCNAIKNFQNKSLSKMLYMSGSPTHDTDLQLIEKPLSLFLKKYSDVELTLLGNFVNVPESLKYLANVKISPLIEYNNLDKFISQYDLNIFSLENTLFNDCKSALKYFESGSVGVATIASPRREFREAINHKINGFLADSSAEWYETLEFIYRSPKTLNDNSINAFLHVFQNYTIESRSDSLAKMFLNIYNTNSRRLISKKSYFHRPFSPFSCKSMPTRILFIANGLIPTLQISFLKPLQNISKITCQTLFEEDIINQHWLHSGFPSPESWIQFNIESFQPDLVVFCRYSGPFVEYILKLLRTSNIPSIFHIDDDLLNVPQVLGEKKYQYHNSLERLNTVNCLLKNANVVYCSTTALRKYINNTYNRPNIVSGQIYCSGRIINSPRLESNVRIGYMASRDHEHNLPLVQNAIIRIMKRHTNVSFHFFGSIRIPDILSEFGGRITHQPPIKKYDLFIEEFSKYKWDIGICPLAPIHFNLMKANTKWVEYTSIGAAVIASKGTVYDECCSDGCGILADNEEDWFHALEQLIQDPFLRYNQVYLAQKKLQRDYSTDQLRDQVLEIFRQAQHSVFDC